MVGKTDSEVLNLRKILAKLLCQTLSAGKKRNPLASRKKEDKMTYTIKKN